MRRSDLPRRAIAAALMTLALGCNSVLGIKEHKLAPGGSGGDTGAAGRGGTGTAGTGGTGTAGGSGSGGGGGGTSGAANASGCGNDAAVGDDASVDGGDAAVAPACGFIIPNPPGLGLPNAMTYTVNTDLTVTDNVTGLTWEGLVDNRTIPQEEAARYCAEEKQPAGTWRLPTLLELMSLVDFTVASPGPTIRAEFEDRPTDTFFWTSSHAPCDPKGWYVDFARGDAHQAVDYTNYRVRCVRGTPSHCAQTRFSSAGLGAIHDATTGLTWQQTVTASHVTTWSEGTAFCSTLGSGWRLPSPAELESIVDLKKSYPPDVPIDLDTFPGTPNAYFWTYAPEVGRAGYAWYVAFLHGHIDTVSVTNGNTFARCVRWDGF